jgi:prepilin-type N-terminal cleavage/methylation domain-containing protein
MTMQIRPAAARSAAGAANSAGFSLLELLVVLACLAVAAMLVLGQQPPRLQAAAGALRSLLIQGRLEAVSRGTPVAITFDNAEREYQLRPAAAAGPLAQLCASAAASTSTLRLDDYRGVSQAGTFKDMIWLPTGTGRDCQGAGVYTQTVRLQQGMREARVIVSRAGRVRSETGLQ